MPNAELEPGALLGHFRIVSRIGAGGMGVVYRATDENLRRAVAIKVLPPEASADPQARARLVHEARSAAALNHPAVCTIHEVGEMGGTVHIAMELVDGVTLAHWRAEARPSADAIVRAAIAVADALEHAHARGVIHRDLKPANVMRTADGRVKVMDFGLARQVLPLAGLTMAETVEALTEPGAVVGTAHYLPPEVLRGAPCDARGDLWSFGVLLFEMFTGRTPFDGGTRFEIAAAILGQPAAPMPDSVPEGLRAIVLRCLEKDPARRFHGAGEVRAALEQSLVMGDPGALAPAVPVRPRRWGRYAALAGVIGLALLATVGGLGRDRIAGCASTLPATAIRSLAVLPLENLSHDPEQAFFADGMTEEIATRLAKIAALRVIAKTSVEGLVLQHRSLPEIGRALRVPAVLRGSVARAGDQVRINVQLVQAASGDLIWAESYDRRIADVLAIQSEVALAIAREIQVHVTSDERARLANAPQVDPAAYETYLRGRAAWSSYTLEGFQSAERHFRRSLELQPGYAPAWAGLADALYGTSSLYLAPNRVMPQAREAALKALQLDANLAEAHTSLGIVQVAYDWDWDAAGASFDKATRLKPGDANAHLWRGHVMTLRGRFDDGLAEIRRALDLDPLSTWVGVNLGWHLIFARRYDEAVAHLTRLRDAEPENFLTHIYLGLALEQHGDPAGAAASLERGVSMYSNNDGLAQLAHAYATAGRRADALRLIGDLRQRRLQKFVPAGDIAYAFAGLGERDSCFHWLDLALEDRSEILIMLGVDPAWDLIREDPRYVAMLRRLRLPE